jgi:hypothetical protein
MATTINLGSMTMGALMAAAIAGQITQDQATAELERRESAAKASAGTGAKKRTIKRNQSAGLFVSDPAFRCYSQAKQKEYQGSFNMDWAVASRLFGKAADPQLTAAIAAFVDSESASSKAA